ncbi:MAG: hypothetical protein J7M25_07825 [Deltaproteobacteria bacterium]|nr:hypothetical protein [Deltaproteobacteria bacterium]
MKMIDTCVCVTNDVKLRRMVRRTLQATGTQVTFADSCDDLSNLSKLHPAIIIVDQQSADTDAVTKLMASVTWPANLLLVGNWERWEEGLNLLYQEQCDNLLCREAPLEEDELVVTSIKLLSHDIFGLEKYLTWGTVAHEATIATYDEKRAAVQKIADFAQSVGIRRHAISRIEVVADELLMNALYDAPVLAQGASRADLMKRAIPGGGAVGSESVLLRYACDGRFLALSVQDSYGQLRKNKVLDQLVRASEEKGQPLRDPNLGAGLGLYFVMQSVSRFVANVKPGETTEVICLFDLRKNAKDPYYDAHSLHIFTIDPDEDAEAMVSTV